MNVRPKGKLGALLLLAVSAAPAYAADAQWYGTVHAGRNRVDSWPLTVHTGTTQTPGQLLLDDGTHAGFAVGSQHRSARFELEIQHGRLGIRGGKLGTATQVASAKGRYDTVMVNGYGTLELGESFQAYAGLGAGYARVSLPEVWLTATCQCIPKVTDRGGVYQARVGAELVLSPKHYLDLQYTRLHLPSLATDNAPRTVHYGGRSFGVIELGYRFVF